MIANTLEERLEERYIFLSCDKGYWRTVEDVTEMKCMSKNHLKNSINMIKKYGIDPLDKKYQQEIESKMESKVKELEEALSEYRNV